MNRHISAFMWVGLLLSVGGCASAIGVPPTTAADTAPRALDGNTLLVAGNQVRLWGIAAPGHETELGQQAAKALESIVADHAIACVTKDRSVGVVTAICTLPDGSDIGSEMVRRGWAFKLNRM